MSGFPTRRDSEQTPKNLAAWTPTSIHMIDPGLPLFRGDSTTLQQYLGQSSPPPLGCRVDTAVAHVQVELERIQELASHPEAIGTAAILAAGLAEDIDTLTEFGKAIHDPNVQRAADSLRDRLASLSYAA